MLSDKWINGIPLADKKLLSMCLTIPPAFPPPYLILIDHVKFLILSGLIKTLGFVQTWNNSLAQTFFLIKICV